MKVTVRCIFPISHRGTSYGGQLHARSPSFIGKLKKSPYLARGQHVWIFVPPARNTPSTGKPANVLQQVSNLASLASVARGGYVLPTTLRSLFFFHVSSMSPCIATISNSKCLASLVVPAAHGVLAQPTQKYSVQAFQPTVRMRDSDPRLPRHLLPVAVFPPGCDPSQTHAY